MNQYIDNFVALCNQAVQIWLAGGWAMPAIAAVSLLLFGLGMHLYLGLRATGFRSVREARWKRWIDDPSLRRGPVGELLDLVADLRTVDDAECAFREIRKVELAPFERDLRVMKICVGAAPLLGLLGTVTGMLTTFDALATGSGGQQTMSQIASGISEALITTETGLLVALPGLFFQYNMARTIERYRTFLAQVESVVTQIAYRRERDDAIRTAA